MFLQGVIGSTGAQLWTLITDFRREGDDIGKITNQIGSLLPKSSKFFLNYIILRAFMSMPLRFLITQPGVWQCWLR
jgi:hypothetical protein